MFPCLFFFICLFYL